MAILECAISGLKIKVDHVPTFISKEIGYYHPIFALEYKSLYGLYAKHCSEHLTPTDSYLLFLAFLHQTDHIKWNHPAKVKPNSPAGIKLVENNLLQLIQVIETTDLIRHPKFKQPKFVVNEHNCHLLQIPNWITAWQDNIEQFKSGIRSQKLQEDIVKLENKLSKLLHSGLSPEQYIHAVANWAAKAADFPKDKKDEWCKIIRACYNPSKIFTVSLYELKRIQDYCLENIEHGSIHAHSLMEAIKSGIRNNINYLGINVNIDFGYTLISPEQDKSLIELEILKASAPLKEPCRSNFKSNLEYIKAKLKFKVVQNATITEEGEEQKNVIKETKQESSTSTSTLTTYIQGKETKL